MRLGEREFGTRELNEHVQRAARAWEDLPLEVEATPFRQLDLRERFRSDWPDEDGLLKLRLARVRQVRELLTRLSRGERVEADEAAELVDELLGIFLDSPWRAAHLALVHTYRWAGADDERSGHDADAAFPGHAPASLAEHAFSTALLALGAAAHLGWSAGDVRRAGLTALLQDVGHLLLPPRVLTGEDDPDAPLTGAQRRHPALSIYALGNMTGLPATVRRAVYQHHERIDGQGYPDHLPAERICALAKLVGPADAYMSLLEAKRGTPPNLPSEALLELLRQMKAKLWDRDCVRALLRVVGLYPPGSTVKLESGRLALVLAVSPHAPNQPLLLPFAAAQGGQPLPVDLRRQEFRGVRIRGGEARWLRRELPQLPPTSPAPTQQAA